MTTIYLHPDRLHVTRHTDYNRQIHLQIHEGDTPATIFFSESHAKTLRDELIKLLPPTEPENPPEAEAVPIDDPCPPVVWGPKAGARARIEKSIAGSKRSAESHVMFNGPNHRCVADAVPPPEAVAEMERSPDYWWLCLRYSQRDGNPDGVAEAQRRLQELGVEVRLATPAPASVQREARR